MPTVSTIRGRNDTKTEEGLDGITTFNNFNVLMDGLVADDHELFLTAYEGHTSNSVLKGRHFSIAIRYALRWLWE